MVVEFNLWAHAGLNDRGEFMVDELVDAATEGELLSQKISLFKKNWDRMPVEGECVTLELKWHDG